MDITQCDLAFLTTNCKRITHLICTVRELNVVYRGLPKNPGWCAQFDGFDFTLKTVVYLNFELLQSY